MECDFNLNKTAKRISSCNNSSCLKLKTLVKSQTTMMSRKSRTDMIRLAVLLTIISYVHDHLTYSPNPHTVLPQGNTSSLLSSGRVVVVAVTLTR